MTVYSKKLTVMCSIETGDKFCNYNNLTFQNHAQQLVEMTPPEESGDVRAAAAARLSTPTAQTASDPTSTVFLSPDTPTTNAAQQQQPSSKKTLTYPTTAALNQ